MYWFETAVFLGVLFVCFSVVVFYIMKFACYFDF